MKNKSSIFIITFICLGWLTVGCQNSQDSSTYEKAKTEESGFSIQLTSLGPSFFDQDNFVYNIDARFQADITKSRLKKMRRITDFDERINVENILEVRNTSVTILNDDYDDVKQVVGKTNELTEEQIDLIGSAPYSTDIRLRMDYIESSEYYDTPQHNYTTPHITIIPENQARYEKGKSDLISYLKKESRREVVKTKGYAVEPGKVRFTISESGTVKDVVLISTCGHGSVDKRMVDLIKKMPGKWKPAEDSEGNKVEEQLVFYFGSIGC